MTDEPRARRRRLPWWCDIPVGLAVALAIAMVITTFVAQAFVIPSSSMSPTLVKGDRIVVQKWSGSPERGDVVVFRDPGQWLDEQDDPTRVGRLLQAVGLSPEGGHLVKRVVGVAGDEVRCCDEQGRTLVNGSPLVEPYLAEPDANASVPFQVTVPRGRVWVEGDNRGNSEDSRLQTDTSSRGFVPVDLVVGKVWFRMWPLSRLGGSPGTAAFDDVPAPGRG